MKETKKKEEEILESKVQPIEQPDDIKMHENGILYKEIQMGGLDKPIKLFNTIKPQRLDGETHMEYKIRRKLLKMNEPRGTLFHNSGKLGTYKKEKK